MTARVSPESEPPVRLPHDVWAISVTSLFSDWSYEMILPVLPFFLALDLHATPAEIGGIEGVAVLVQSLAQWYSGSRVAGMADRKLRGAAGYATTTISHGLLTLAQSWPVVGALRSIAWGGRGERMPVKQAIISDASSSKQRGRAFGLEQALDSAGAILGTLVAIGFVLSAGTGAFRSIFVVSVIPGLVAVLTFSLLVRDRRERPPRSESPPPPASRVSTFPKAYWPFLVTGGLFGFGFFNILLALLAVGERFIATPGLGLPAAIVLSLVVYLVYNLVSTVGAYPAGLLADRFPGLPLLAVSYLLFAGVDLLLVLGGALVGAVGVFIVAGFQVSLVSVAQSTWIGRLVPSQAVGRAFGAFGAVQGAASLAGSVAVGFLWTAVSPDSGFALSGAVCVAAALLTVFWISRYIDSDAAPSSHSL
jgi:MFS family permease